MSENLQRYVPEFDEDAVRQKLSGFSREQLLDMLVDAYRTTRVVAKGWDEESKKLDHIRAILDEPSKLSQMPGVPSAEDLRRKFEE